MRRYAEEELSGFAMRAIATGGGGGIGAKDVDEESFGEVIASSITKTTYKRVELSAETIEQWATAHGSAARELPDELNSKMKALVDLGLDQIPFNVQTRSKLGNLVADYPSPIGDAANAALVAWSNVITAKQKDDRADRKAKSSRKLNVASAKAAPLTIDAQQAAVDELKRRKAGEGSTSGGKRKRGKQDEGEEEDADDLVAAAREAGINHLDDDDEDYLAADSEEGLTDEGPGTSVGRSFTVIKRYARLEFLDNLCTASEAPQRNTGGRDDAGHETLSSKHRARKTLRASSS